MTTAGSNTYTYDANGNMTGGAGRTMTWTSSNLPSLIRDIPTGNETVFTYGPGRERIEQRILRGGLTTTVTYIDAVYEKRARLGEPDELVHYIRAGAMVAIFTKIDDGLAATDKTRYLHKDHLGSIEAISDESGAVTEYLSYDPHGKRRLADWQPGTPVGAGAETPRGFTGHEMLDGVGLIHMNGRVYDPTLGRFISADPTIQYPDTTQGFNRYTYVNNNPLSFTDPSGFGFFSSIAKFFGGIVKAVVNVVKGAVNTIKSALQNPSQLLLLAAATAAAFVIGPAVAGYITNAAATSFTASIAGAVGGPIAIGEVAALTAAAASQVGIVANVVSGVAAGFAGGLIASGGDLQTAGIGALSGGLAGLVSGASFLNTPDISGVSVRRIVANGVVSGVRDELRGGKFAAGFLRSVGSSALDLWETTKWNLKTAGQVTLGDFKAAQRNWGQMVAKTIAEGALGAAVAKISGQPVRSTALIYGTTGLANELYRAITPATPNVLGPGGPGIEKGGKDKVIIYLNVNNYGVWDRKGVDSGFFTEGNTFSRIMNGAVPGMDAVANNHDIIAVRGEGSICESSICASTMLPSALISYGAIARQYRDQVWQ